MASNTVLKEDNIRRVRRCFYLDGRDAWTRADLCGATGISPAGMGNMLQELERQGVIAASGTAPSTGGRPGTAYRLRKDHAHIALLSFTCRQGGILSREERLDLEGRSIFDRTVRKKRISTAEVRDTARSLVRSDQKARLLVVSIPAIVDDRGSIGPCDLPELEGADLAQMLEEACGVPVRVENDGNLAAIGYARLHPEAEHIAVVYQPDRHPVGIGLVLAGKLYRGRGGCAGEAGRFRKEAQEALLRSDPARLVLLHIALVDALVAPQRIAWCCPVVDELPPHPTIGAEVERIEDLDGLTSRGARWMGRNLLWEAGV